MHSLLSLIIEFFQGTGYDKSTEDYNMLVSLIDRLAEKPSNVLRNAHNKFIRENPMSMEEINTEIERYRSELRTKR